MKLNLNYNPTYEFSTADIFDATDPPLFFEAVSRHSASWSRLVRQWRAYDEDGNSKIPISEANPDMAEEIIGMVIVSVRQEDGPRYPLNGREGAASLRAAIEEENPGKGASFMCQLAQGHYNHHFLRVDKLMGNSETPSTQSPDGASQTSPNGRTEQQPEEKPVKQS